METEHRVQRRRKEKVVKTNLIVWVNLNSIDIERTNFASGAETHVKFQSTLGRVQWSAFNLPVNGRGAEMERALIDAHHFIIHGEGQENYKLMKDDLQRIKSMLEKVRMHNKKLKVYTNAKVGQRVDRDVNSFNNIDSLIKEIK